MKKNSWLLTLILIITFVLHLLAIGKVPPGVTNDEAVDGYDAYSILKTGRDQWGKSFPLEFKSFGDYKLPLFIYSLTPAIYFFGLNVFSLRFTATIFAVLLVWGLFIIGKELFNEAAGLIASFLLAISPWFFALSRFAHECPLHTLFVLLGVYFLIKALKQGKYYLISFVFFVMSFYTYHAARLFVPLFLLVLFFVLRKKIYPQRNWLLIALFLSFVLCLPILQAMLFGGAKARFRQLNLTKDIGTLNILNQKRGECLAKAPFLFCRMLYNKPFIFTQKFITNYINHFSFDFLFLKGSAFGVMGDAKFFYLFLLPFFLGGVFYLLKERKLNSLILITWLLMAPIADSLTGEGHFSRAFLMIVPICLISAWGIFQIWRSLKDVWTKKLFVFLFVSVLLLETTSFLSDYFFYFPKYYSIYTHYEYQPLFEYLARIEKDYSQIYISRRYHDTKQYIFYLFYSSFDPKRYQAKEEVEWQVEKDGWVWIKRIGKWHFVDSIPNAEELPDKTLLIGDLQREINKLVTPEKEGEMPIAQHLKTIYFLNGDPAFSVAVVQKA